MWSSVAEDSIANGCLVEHKYSDPVVSSKNLENMGNSSKQVLQNKRDILCCMEEEIQKLKKQNRKANERADNCQTQLSLCQQENAMFRQQIKAAIERARRDYDVAIDRFCLTEELKEQKSINDDLKLKNAKLVMINAYNKTRIELFEATRGRLDTEILQLNMSISAMVKQHEALKYELSLTKEKSEGTLSALNNTVALYNGTERDCHMYLKKWNEAEQQIELLGSKLANIIKSKLSSFPDNSENLPWMSERTYAMNLKLDEFRSLIDNMCSSIHVLRQKALKATSRDEMVCLEKKSAEMIQIWKEIIHDVMQHLLTTVREQTSYLHRTEEP